MYLPKFLNSTECHVIEEVFNKTVVVAKVCRGIKLDLCNRLNLEDTYSVSQNMETFQNEKNK